MSKLTPEMEAEFAEMWRAGIYIDVIKARFGIGSEKVAQLRFKLDLVPRIRQTGWNEQRIKIAKRLWIEGKSATEIAMALNCGLTRNAVIGKIHRLGLTSAGRAACAAPAPDVRKRTFSAPKPPRSHVRPPKPGPQNKPALIHGDYAPSSEAMRLARAAEGRAANDKVAKGMGVESPNARPWMENRRLDECNWPIGERYDIRSCCNPVKARGWCAGHLALGVAETQPNAIRPRDASGFARFDRVEKDRPVPVQREQTLWDEGRAA